MKLYIHIPFCKSKCIYCDFKSYPCAVNNKISEYLNGLIREIELAGKEYGDRDITSIYLGGGTPSLLTEEQFEGLFFAIKNSFTIKDNIEITVECNPESVSRDKLSALKKLGVNRISLGVQSLDDANLKAIGRIHNAETALAKIVLIKEFFDNLSVDFIVGLPFDTAEKIEDEILTVSPYVQHISVYMLSVESGTPLEMLAKSAQIVLPSQDQQIDLFSHACKILEQSGFERYEVSNFAKNKFYSNHNSGYWTREEYLGLGLNASSLVFDEKSEIQCRLKNTDNLENYLLECRNSNKFSDFKRDIEVLSSEEIFEEKILLGLRLNSGVPKAILGNDRVNLLKTKFANYIVDLGDKIALTGMGMDVMNHILVEIL